MMSSIGGALGSVSFATPKLFSIELAFNMCQQLNPRGAEMICASDDVMNLVRAICLLVLLSAALAEFREDIASVQLLPGLEAFPHCIVSLALFTMQRQMSSRRGYTETHGQT